jgi:hypothetical protein
MPGSCFLTTANAELGEDLGDVVLDAVGRDAESDGNLGVSQAIAEVLEDFLLSRS